MHGMHVGGTSRKPCWIQEAPMCPLQALRLGMGYPNPWMNMEEKRRTLLKTGSSDVSTNVHREGMYAPIDVS